MNLPSLKKCITLIADGPTVSSINLPSNHQDTCVSHMEYIPFTTAGSTSWYEYNNFKSILVSLLEPTPLLALPQTTDVTMLSKVISDIKEDMETKPKERKAGIVNSKHNIGLKPYNCDEWDSEISFPQSSHLNVHKQRHNSGKPYKPRKNDKAYKHNGMYKCNVCGVLFKHTSNFRIHIGEEPFKCGECGVSFTQSSDLKFHELSHNGIKPHICSECGKSFDQSSQLTSHLRIHNGKHPYACEICQKQFITTTHLKYHRRLHTGERPFTCLICEMSYKDKNTLRVHMKKHTEERPFKCLECGELFKSKPALNQHKKLHLDNGLYSCENCQKSFKSSIYLKNHLSKICGGPQSGKKRGRPRKPTTKREFALPSHEIYQLTAETEKVQNQIMKEGDLCIKQLDQQVNYGLDQQINQHEQIQIFSVPNTEPEFVVIHLQTNDANNEQMRVLHIAQVSY